MNNWEGFNKGNWCDKIDVKNFIELNYTPYDGDESFLQNPTERTNKVMNKVNQYLKEEQQRGGVYDICTTRISNLLTHENGYVDKELDLVVGLQTDTPLKRAVNPFGGVRLCITSCQQYGYELDPKIIELFKYRTTHNDGVFMVYNDEIRLARKTGLITGLPDGYGRGRIIGDYRRIPLYGMDFLIEEKKKDKRNLQKECYTEENIQLIEEVEKQLLFMSDLVEMAKRYGYDITKPAKNCKEAIQFLYFGYLGAIKEQNGAAMSIGRISTFIDIYIERDLKKGLISELEAQEWMDDFIIKLRLVRHLRSKEYNELFAGDPTWVTMSEGGVLDNNNHLVTKNCFRVLQTLYNLGPSSEPNITILWSKYLPLNYKKFCAKVSIETNSIQYENDDLMRESYGHDYSIACCVSAMKTGKQMQFFGARCNVPKVLLMALNGGRDEMMNIQVGPKMDVYPNEKLDYNKVMERFNIYRNYTARLYVNAINAIHYMHDKHAYERLQMSLHDTNVERLVAFGIAGLSVVADSFSAIKYADVYPIYDDRKLIVDFEVKGSFPCYGNDDDRVDFIARDVVKDFYNNLCKFNTYRNSKPTLSILTITSNVVYGKKTGSTPDGRKKGEFFAPGANPMHNRDLNGALASLNSVAKISYDDAKDGISNTFSIVPDALGKNLHDRILNLIDILDGYFSQGAHHLNVNVVTKEKLIDAMNNPEKYPNLTVRISGYAVNFNKLSKNHQLEIIERTFHEKL